MFSGETIAAYSENHARHTDAVLKARFVFRYSFIEKGVWAYKILLSLKRDGVWFASKVNAFHYEWLTLSGLRRLLEFEKCYGGPTNNRMIYTVCEGPVCILIHSL